MDEHNGSSNQINDNQGNSFILGDGSGNGSTFHISQVAAAGEPPQTFEAARVWRTPFTANRLHILGALCTLITLWQGAEMVTRSSTTTGFAFAPLAVALGLGVMLVCGVALGLLRKHNLALRWRILPGLYGSKTGRLSLVRLRGTCSCCEALGFPDVPLAFYARPTLWHDVYDANGRSKRIIDERTLAAECTRNHDHWWPIDRSDTAWLP